MSRTAPAADTGLPNAIHAIGHPMPRRGFLAGLAALPLVGGSVTLLGKPSAVAEAVTTEMLEAYKTWLFYERRWLAWEMAGDPIHQQRYRNFAPADDRIGLSDNIQDCFLFVGRSGSYHDNQRSQPSTRAALVMSTVGCDWRDRDDHAARRRV